MRSLLNLIGQYLRNKFNTKEMTKITMVGRRGRKIRTHFLRPVLAGVGVKGLSTLVENNMGVGECGWVI